jgi:hypothetical protein
MKDLVFLLFEDHTIKLKIVCNLIFRFFFELTISLTGTVLRLHMLKSRLSSSNFSLTLIFSIFNDLFLILLTLSIFFSNTA